MNKIMKESEEVFTEMKSRGDYRLQKFMKNYIYRSDTDFDANKPGIIKKGETGDIMLNGIRTPVKFYDSKPTDEKPVRAASACITKSGEKYLKLDKKFIKNTKAKDLKYVLNHEQGHLEKNIKYNPDRNDPKYDEFDKKVEPLLKYKRNNHTSIKEFEADKYAQDLGNSKEMNKALERTMKYIGKTYNRPLLKKSGTKEEKKANELKFHKLNSEIDNDLKLRRKAMGINIKRKAMEIKKQMKRNPTRLEKEEGL